MFAALMTVNVLAFAGALRKDSFNRKLIAIAARYARSMGAEVDLLDLHEIAMPLYDGDLELQSGPPEGALAFKKRIEAAHVILLSSPEYNQSIPGTLKNAIDWASRPPSPFRGKVVGLMTASPGPYGGTRSLGDLRRVFTALGTFIVPSQIALVRAADAFNEKGELREPSLDRTVEGLVREALETAKKLYQLG